MNKPIDITEELMNFLFKEQFLFSDENINWHFINYPNWEIIFKKHYPNFTKETYLKNSIELLNKNNYTFKLLRFTLNEKSKFYNLFSIELYYKDNWILESETLTYCSILNSWLVYTLDEINYETFE